MENCNFDLYLKEKVFHIPILFDSIVNINPNIYKSLIFKHQYQVESNVDVSIFRCFIDYLVNKIQPEINLDNINDYLKLSEEFKFQPLLQLIQSTKEFNQAFLDINSVKQSYMQNNFTRDEDLIASNLDNYIEHYGIEMMKLPIQLLFNIFTNPKRKLSNYEKLYELIQNYYNETNDFRIFSLLTTFTDSKSSETFIIKKMKE